VNLRESWVLFALGSAFFAGLTALFGKLGVAGINSNLSFHMTYGPQPSPGQSVCWSISHLTNGSPCNEISGHSPQPRSAFRLRDPESRRWNHDSTP
jgi:hypothetical protein